MLELLLAALTLFLLTPPEARGQISADSIPVRPTHPSSRAQAMAWSTSSAMLLASLVFDERIRDAARANQSESLDRLTGGADLLGTAGHIVPALASTYVISRIVGQHAFADATLRVGLSYAAADALEALLKPVVGRVRPNAGREPLTFRLLSGAGQFHSFPSAHVVHIASLVSATAIEAHRPWVTAIGGTAIAYVGAQRVYRDQHWSSDVIASAMLGIEAALAAHRWLERRIVTR